VSRSDFPWREVLIGAFLRLSFEGALVVVIGAIYVGFGLATAGRRSAIVETIGGVTMLVLATVGAAQAPWLLVLAWCCTASGTSLTMADESPRACHSGIRRSAPRPNFVLAGLFAGIH
jgi:hypothetical protein